MGAIEAAAGQLVEVASERDGKWICGDATDFPIFAG